jgi:hypothetical protein
LAVGRYSHARFAGELDLDRRRRATVHLAHRLRISSFGRGDHNLRKFIIAGAELLPPQVDLIGTDLGPARHFGNNRTGFQ